MTVRQFDEPNRRERGRAAGKVGVIGTLPPVGYLECSASMRTLAIIAALTLAGCTDDVVTTRFDTLDEAKAQRAFVRGWLPPVMPESARGIVETNNLDLNIGSGVCSYDIIRERTAYLERLVASGATLRTEQATDILTLATNRSRWEIRLPRSAGWLYWKITLQK